MLLTGTNLSEDRQEAENIRSPRVGHIVVKRRHQQRNEEYQAERVDEDIGYNRRLHSDLKFDAILMSQQSDNVKWISISRNIHHHTQSNTTYTTIHARSDHQQCDVRDNDQHLNDDNYREIAFLHTMNVSSVVRIESECVAFFLNIGRITV